MKKNLSILFMFILLLVCSNLLGQNLTVNGSLHIVGSNHLAFGHPNGNGVINFGNNGVGSLYFRSLPIGNNINTFNHLMILTYDGKLGIGTYNPGNYKLAVNGSILAKSITVDADWADFVFNPNYKLLSIEELEKHIKSQGHLPDVPSEKEVQENGIDLGEMQSKLLQKIEELTLYVIQLNNVNKELSERVQKLEK